MMDRCTSIKDSVMAALWALTPIKLYANFALKL